jgi:peroxiredoxin
MLRTALALALLIASTAGAGKFNKKISIGDPAPAFKKLPGIDGKAHSLADFKGKDILILCVTANECVVAQDYEERIVAFVKKYASAKDSKIAFVAVSVGLDEDDRLPKMKERAKAKGFNFPYLHDDTQGIGRALGAAVTPELFVFDKARKLAYQGRFDDSITPEEVKVKYLEQAVDALLAGKKVPVSETERRGCVIEYAKKK